MSYCENNKNEIKRRYVRHTQIKGKTIHNLICILLCFEFEELKNCSLDVYIVPALCSGFTAFIYIINVFCKKI